MNTPIIRFQPNGQGHCLYTEAIDLHRLGTLAIERASHVEFADASQQWQVFDPQGRLLHQAPSREACLQWEFDHFNGDDAA